MLKQLNSFLKSTVYPFIDKVYYHPILHPFIHPIFTISKDTIAGYSKHKVLRLGAALAYYTIFSLPALIIVIVGLVGFFFGDSAAQGEIFAALVDYLGADAANQIQNAVINIGTPDTNWWATVLGVSVLIFVATGVFYALQDTLNHIFEVKEVPRKVRILEVIINRILSLGMVLSVGGLLITSIILNALLLKVSDFINNNEAWVHSILPDFLIPYIEYLTDYFLVFLNLGLSVFLIALFFAMMYKILPAVKLKWKYIWAGAFFAAILFWFGEIAMGIYLSNTNMVSAYGAAGSLIVVLIWVYYSAQLIFLGAEFMIALCKYNEVDIPPKKFAVALLNTKKKRTVKPRANFDEIAQTFVGTAPPSFYQLTLVEEGTPLEEVTKILEIQEINEENEALGFSDEKNIDLTEENND